MTIKVALEHRTSYVFDRPVKVFPHVLRLRPAPHTRTPVNAYSLAVSPHDHFLNWQQDAFANYQARLVFPERTTELSFTVSLIADMTSINPFDFFIEEWAENYGFSYPPELNRDLRAYLTPIDPDTPNPLVNDFVERHRPTATVRMIDYLVTLNQAVRDEVGYTVRLETGVQTPEETLTTAIGSCRDSAWLLVSVLRRLGLAARFVSGYLVQLTSDIAPLDGPSGPATDFTDLHAWTEVYLPGAGWVGMDPTSGLFAGEGHIPLAATPHPSAAAPITGATESCHAVLDFSNSVSRFHEDPRVTLPYTPEQWNRIVDLGASVDARMTAADIRLTMGGEPTFVSVDNHVDREWTTEADGPHKRELASALAARLTDAWAPTGLVRRGQGKWYPGEPLPRWQIDLLWRNDGKALWHNRKLLADPWPSRAAAQADIDRRAPGGQGPLDSATAHRARAFIIAFAERLKIPAAQVIPAYEDPLLRLAELIRLPPGAPAAHETAATGATAIDLPPDADTSDRRRTLLNELDSSVTVPTAYLIPLSRTDDDLSWESAQWVTRRGRIVLMPGNSPAGLRLPLDSLFWQDAPRFIPADPTGITVDPLPDIEHPVPHETDADDDDSVAPADVEKNAPAPPARISSGHARTALVAEERGGLLYIFLPPTQRAEDYIELIALIEHAAQTVGTAVVIEGYGPPHDPRLTSMTITPDPGVIEVNIYPTESFAEQCEQLRTLYDHARHVRLGTETFDVDGGHSGTGGGNHITLGGRSPSDSPMLRRPDLLVSMLTYWQRHPSLSYLFSGTFVGTTSQAPRADEGRESALYEMEIAFAEIDRITNEINSGADDYHLPWVTDRSLRHLLTDITGNTHRAEFCIDKLYSPDSATGRLGILELRGFEMPPHHRMAMVQSLLVRSLVSWFWERPYRMPLRRHGADLHGRHLLPHYVIADIAGVAADLRAAGYEFDTSWLDPFTEFRFPRLGTVSIGHLEIELRGAIEPWNVLGEESAAGSTARYVDSSVERVQVRVTGGDDDRYVLTCNGFPVPLRPTGRAGEAVAGIRFRAWQPPSSLHPTITIDTPLTFDLVDTYAARSVGGATYHAVHPGGRAYDAPPVNAVEAESRRNGRFTPSGHTAGAIDIARLREHIARMAIDASVPMILDLRRARTVLR